MDTAQTTSAPSRPGGFFRNVRDDAAYVLPMGAFLALTWLGGQFPDLFPIAYTIKTLVAAVLLYLLWSHYTKISWDYFWTGVLVGVVGVVQWIGTEELLLSVWPNYPRATSEPFNPFVEIESPWLLAAFVAVRWMGPTLVVPVMEELFWRDFLWRSLIAPNDFKLARVGEWDRNAFVIVALLFASVHMQMWVTSIVWALLIGGLLLSTRSLGACIIAHGVTNFLLGAYVLVTQDWKYW
ncbi:MAG TPA: CAAX prenyl protease-related protein [Tepidisphaeraceae bacterium]|nr:CAAX prenyl protease-related protein [Tepidisphaeraceae bacterium]